MASQPKIDSFPRKQFRESTVLETFFSDSFPQAFLPELKVDAMAD